MTGVEKIRATLERLYFQPALPKRRHDCQGNGRFPDAAFGA
jgi:hypothetical protein